MIPMSLDSIITKIAKSFCADHVRGLLHFNGRVQGVIEFAITNKNHVHLSTPNISKLKLRNDEFNVSLHLFEIGGVWQVRNADRPYITRNFDDAPPSFRRIIIDEITKAWNEHIKAHPEQTAEAEGKRKSDLLNSIRLDIASTEKELTELKDMLSDIEIEGSDLDEIQNKISEIKKKYH
jgi:hypothetical protein